jgi:glycosyltransferase involved in cell wall biosynthesis
MVIRAAWGLPPDIIDASGYQLLVIDTPMYFKVQGIGSANIISVVHDIIPLRDPMMTPYWRNLFWKKLEAVLKLQPNFAFVSEYSRSIFRLNFPKYKLRNSFILYPTLRNSTLRRAKAATSADLVPFAPSGLNNLERSVAYQNDEDAKRIYENAMEKRIAMGARYQRVAKVEDAYLQTGWDTRLPYFVTVVSDEPRKNIAIFIKAFTTLRGRANMVVLGNVIGERYVGDDPDALGNIRFTGYIFENEKSRIIARSAGLIFPSYTEGFGIPITEGALYGKPVLCSDIDVFREVAAEHAFYFDPYKDETLVEAVDAVIASPEESGKRAAALQARVLERFTVEANKRRVTGFLTEIGLVKPGA